MYPIPSWIAPLMADDAVCKANTGPGLASIVGALFSVTSSKKGVRFSFLLLGNEEARLGETTGCFF